MASSLPFAVLLPVRLETRFYPPGPSALTWRLRLLVVPDTIWVDRHRPFPTADEMQALTAFYASAPGGLQSAEGKLAFDVLASRVGGGARAEWLVRAYPQGTTPKRMSRPLHYGQITGFPTALELWMGRGLMPPVAVKQWPVDVSRLDVSLPNPATNQERWYTAWTEAQATGLGVEVDLGPQYPDDIDVLYVVGIGTTPAEQLFAHHRRSGALGAIEPGTPTNAIAGAASADLGRSTSTWYDIAAGANSPGAASSAFSRAITGRPDAFGAVVGDTFDHGAVGQAMMSALWGVLWGHSLKDIWNLGDAVQSAGLWAVEHVLPEGHVPPVRVGDQPYGVLPATSLKQWQADPNDPQAAHGALEAGVAPYLALARTELAGLAASQGTVDGANTARLLELIGQTPTTSRYLYRMFLSEEVLEYFYGPLPGHQGGERESSFDHWWNERAAAVSQWLGPPARKYVATGNAWNITLPLVAPDMPAGSLFGDYFTLDVTALPSEVFAQYQTWVLAPTLLGRLLVQALIVTAAEVHRAANGIGGPALEPPVSSASLTQIAQWATLLTKAEIQAVGPHASAALYESTRKAIDVLKAQPIAVLDRVLRATLDSACHRFDPWILALPWRRLAQSQASDRPLGAYGWVDAPRPGSPGPTAGGLVHAPSERQALTAAIIRDKFIDDPQPARWSMNLTSRSARMAEALADEVRAGAYIQEVLGREVERIAGTKATVEQLRATFPMHAEHAGRRVCDGEAVLKADPASLDFDAAQLQALDEVRAAVDAYGDLLVAQAVHDVVSGRGAAAGAAMDAAAGLSAPPDLEVIRTARSGRSVNTTVAVLLQDVAVPAVDPAASPVQMAEPAVAAYLVELLGDSTSPNWTWSVLMPDGAVQVRTLADLGWHPADAAAVSEEALVQLVTFGGVVDTAWLVKDAGGTPQTVTLSSLALSPSALNDLPDAARLALVAGKAGPGSTVISELPQPGTRSQRRARRVLAVLGERPAVPENLADGDLSDDAVREDLLKRYDLLRLLAAETLKDLAARPAAAALVRIARWGISPVAAEGESLDALRAKAVAALDERLLAAPTIDDASQLETAAIARAIAELASSDGKFPVLSRIAVDALPVTLTETMLDRDWLTVNAAVRLPLARFEAFQLDGELSGEWAPMVSFTNRPDDPWQQNPEITSSGPRSSRLIVAYCPRGLSGTMAAGLLDSWGETVPDVQQSTAAAVGFNAPAARAPQAILLAVAPDANTPLTIPTAVDILVETRELARARAVTLDALGQFSVAMPMTVVAVGLGEVK